MTLSRDLALARLVFFDKIRCLYLTFAHFFADGAGGVATWAARSYQKLDYDMAGGPGVIISPRQGPLS